jgi:hypothetical protein
MSSKSKRQQTMAKRTREQKVREKRVLKQEKKAAAAAAKAAGIDLQVVEADGDAIGAAGPEPPAGVAGPDD